MQNKITNRLWEVFGNNWFVNDVRYNVFSRYIFIAGAYSYQVGLEYSDRFYTPMPLYHTAAGIMCIGQGLLYGCTIVIRKKFSASGYFQDVSKYNCTVSHYYNNTKSIILLYDCSTSGPVQFPRSSCQIH